MGTYMSFVSRAGRVPQRSGTHITHVSLRWAVRAAGRPRPIAYMRYLFSDWAPRRLTNAIYVPEPARVQSRRLTSGIYVPAVRADLRTVPCVTERVRAGARVF